MSVYRSIIKITEEGMKQKIKNYLQEPDKDRRWQMAKDFFATAFDLNDEETIMNHVRWFYRAYMHCFLREHIFPGSYIYIPFDEEKTDGKVYKYRLTFLDLLEGMDIIDAPNGIDEPLYIKLSTAVAKLLPNRYSTYFFKPSTPYIERVFLTSVFDALFFILRKDSLLEVEHDFTDEKFFMKTYVNVYGNIENEEIHCKHEKIEINAYVEDLFDRNRTYNLPMHYCTKCERYFVLPEQIEVFSYDGLYPKLRYNPVRERRYNRSNEKSVIAMYGYKAGHTGGMNRNERRRLLTQLVERDVITADEIARHLFALTQSAKARTSANLKWAIRDWEEDIKFLQENYKVSF